MLELVPMSTFAIICDHLRFGAYIICNSVVRASIVRSIYGRYRVLISQLELGKENAALVGTLVATAKDESSDEFTVRFVRSEEVVPK